ncbi:MAG: DUF1735 domain-containing protein [Bacteroidales bacterium]|nr:DUF1735 domain-containing protein [Bacteroidales bacterium]
MKNIWKIFFAAALFCFAFTACDDDDDADVKGVVGDFAYIVGGTEADYQATTSYVYHTPDLEDGTVQMAVTLGLTRAQSTATTIYIDVDNSKVTNAYSEVPAGILSYSSSVTIPAGETSATVNVNIASSDFPKLVDPQYMAVFKIVDVTGNVKVSTNSNSAILYIITETIDPANNLIFVEESETSFLLLHYDDGDDGDSISKRVTITGSEGAYKDFDITLAVDNSLIDAYNAANGTSYVALSNTSIVNIPTALMEEDGTETSITITISDEDRDANFTDENGYLIPIVVSDVGTATISDGCGVTYLIVEVQYIEGSMDYFSALYLGDYRLSTWAQFSSPIDMSNGYTYVFHVFLDESTRVSRIGDFADLDENWINMLRFGQKGDYDTRLEWFVGPNNCRQNLYSEAFELQQWYQVALVYSPTGGDNNYGEYRFYVEGELQDSYSITESDHNTMANLVSPKFQAIEFNSSWGENYRDGNEFHGRLWHMGVFSSAQSQSYIKNYCYHDFSSIALRSAAAYWGFDEGYGYVCAEGTGKYEDVDFSNTIRCDDESSMVKADVSEYVQWKTDSFNKFD